MQKHRSMDVNFRCTYRASPWRTRKSEPDMLYRQRTVPKSLSSPMQLSYMPPWAARTLPHHSLAHNRTSPILLIATPHEARQTTHCTLFCYFVRQHFLAIPHVGNPSSGHEMCAKHSRKPFGVVVKEKRGSVQGDGATQHQEPAVPLALNMNLGVLLNEP